jgi:pimeloyl-ACP methyl ester carboxylesterase
MADRPTLMLLPGLLCDDSVFTHQAAGLKDICDVSSPHFRGFDSIEGMARHVLDLAPPKFALAGFSMGGRVSMQIMALAPERVTRLCLFDTGAAPEPAGGAAARQPLVDLAYREGMEALANAWLPPMLGKARKDDAAFKKPLVEMVCRATPEQHEKQIKALVERPDFRDVLPKIACPTLVICGEEDASAPVAIHAEMAHAIPGAQLTVVPGSGHFLPVEQPEAFTAALRRWMQR